MCQVLSLLSTMPPAISRALVDIQSGCEITHTYVDLYQQTEARRSALLSSYFFKCNCNMCQCSGGNGLLVRFSVTAQEDISDLLIGGFKCCKTDCNGVVKIPEDKGPEISVGCPMCGIQRTW